MLGPYRLVLGSNPNSSFQYAYSSFQFAYSELWPDAGGQVHVSAGSETNVVGWSPS
jgi:hypothetical protein